MVLTANNLQLNIADNAFTGGSIVLKTSRATIPVTSENLSAGNFSVVSDGQYTDIGTVDPDLGAISCVQLWNLGSAVAFGSDETVKQFWV